MYRSSGKLLIVASMATGLLCAARAPAQPSHQTRLEKSRLTSKGSTPYQETVAAFLEGKAPKIVGGSVAAAGAYPWQVSLGVSWIANPYDAHFCGGSVYSASWIITAAHCVRDNQPEDVSIVAGTNVLRPGSVRHNVRRIIVHKAYVPATSDNDIALLELFEPLALDAKTRAIPLLDKAAEATALIEDATLEVAGWGATNEGGDPVKDLRFVRVPFVTRDTCNRPLAYNGQISNNMICAGPLAGGTDSCQGDSGGPLSVVSASPVLAGVVSWGEGCARPNKVGVYTRVPQYVDWIRGCTVKPDSCNQ
ncbi:MAG: transrane protease serine [Acidobacteriota bacterium]|jgi:secreted trypsin-like serine protease|nr:transrane protease serine [Acidobacteriota bacterium]